MTVYFTQRWPGGPSTTPSPGNPNQGNNGYSFQIALGNPAVTAGHKGFSIKNAGPHQATSAFMPVSAPGRGQVNGGYPHAAISFGSYWIANSPSFVKLNHGGKIKAIGLQPYYNTDMVGQVGFFSGGTPNGNSTHRSNVMFTSFTNKTSIMVGTAGPSHPGMKESHKASSPTHVYWMRGAIFPGSNNFASSFWKMSKQNQVAVSGQPSTSTWPTKYIMQPVSNMPSTNTRSATPWSEDTNSRIYMWSGSGWITTPYISDTSFSSGGNHGAYAAPGDFSWNHGQAVSSKTYAKVFTGGGSLHKYYPTTSNSGREQTIQFPYAAWPYGSSYSIPQADMGQSLVPQTGYGGGNRGGNYTGGHAATSSASAGYVFGGWSGNSSAPNTVSAVINKVRVYPHATADGESTVLGETNYVGHYGGTVSAGGDTNQGMYHAGNPSLTVVPSSYPIYTPTTSNNAKRYTYVFPYSSFATVTSFDNWVPSMPNWTGRQYAGDYIDSWGHANT